MARLKRLFLLLLNFTILFLASAVAFIFRRDLLKKDIWLIREKGTEARDNAYHFYKYVREKHPEINAYYVIDVTAPDYAKVRDPGNVINYNSFRHFLYYCAAKFNISSQSCGAAPQMRFERRFHKLTFLRRKGQKTIFLQHGILLPEVPHALDYDKAGLSLFITSCKEEQQFVVDKYKYPREVAALTGLCRYDNLNDTSGGKKQILVMPTFRMYLGASNAEKPATKSECERFVQSDFYKNYYGFLTSEKLLSLLEKHDYSLVFYLHYGLQSYTECFALAENDRVTVARREAFDVQTLLKDSAVLITDFSSVLTDFGYMEKPEIYFHFDAEDYYRSHYKKGWFDYNQHGFGPVVITADEVCNELSNILDNDAKLSDFYYDRVSKFFYFHDKNNCERTFNAILKLDQEK